MVREATAVGRFPFPPMKVGSLCLVYPRIDIPGHAEYLPEIPVSHKMSVASVHGLYQMLKIACCHQQYASLSMYTIYLTSGELTYPTLGKRKLIFPTAFGWDILVPRRVNDFICRKKNVKFEHLQHSCPSGNLLNPINPRGCLEIRHFPEHF